MTKTEIGLKFALRYSHGDIPGRGVPPRVAQAPPAYPRAESPTHYIAMGFDDDLSNATRKALRSMVDFLVAEKHLSRDDSYMLINVAGDVEITELVDRNKGVHVMMPKSIFK